MRLKNPKSKGARNELRMRDWLEARGYSVTKAGGSLGCWDLVAHRRTSSHTLSVADQVALYKAERDQDDKVKKAIGKKVYAKAYLTAFWRRGIPIVLVQVKSQQWPSPEERKCLVEYINTHDNRALYLMARWKRNARRPELMRYNNDTFIGAADMDQRIVNIKFHGFEPYDPEVL